ncbi:uncharacterized protein LOC133485081 isoform X1 [Phyllopteryx taeniolatus]|uniref:uncharacterized protein LOC133485081 isoform X1 n=1 Tax=Phyllopteryx taeniolatus TaxID=161469 RepID=UPI002AD4F57D|nr:uncharacterized protein LOC133485081 isoform X1 [Phyllopteryx taeniolatus]
MTARLTALLLLSTSHLIQALQPVSLVTAEVGVNVTFVCPRSENMGDIFYWYKMKVGYMIQTIVEGYFGELSLRGQFKNGRFASTRVGNAYILNIANVSKEDEATYTCQAGTSYNMKFIDSAHLLVKDPTHKTFYVKQIPREKSVDAGQSVTLQCSILSESKGNVSQCPNECSVYWFKSGSGDAYPHIIYTDRDKEKAKGSCVYHLSKLIQNSSDTGIYYCAVATCGQILFGQGTNVETRQDLKPVGIVLGALLASSVIVVAVVMV